MLCLLRGYRSAAAGLALATATVAVAASDFDADPPAEGLYVVSTRLENSEENGKNKLSRTLYLEATGEISTPNQIVGDAVTKTEYSESLGSQWHVKRKTAGRWYTLAPLSGQSNLVTSRGGSDLDPSIGYGFEPAGNGQYLIRHHSMLPTKKYLKANGPNKPVSLDHEEGLNRPLSPYLWQLTTVDEPNSKTEPVSTK